MRAGAVNRSNTVLYAQSHQVIRRSGVASVSVSGDVVATPLPQVTLIPQKVVRPETKITTIQTSTLGNKCNVAMNTSPSIRIQTESLKSPNRHVKASPDRAKNKWRNRGN